MDSYHGEYAVLKEVHYGDEIRLEIGGWDIATVPYDKPGELSDTIRELIAELRTIDGILGRKDT